MSITLIDDAGVLRSLILIILPILDVGDRFGSGMGVKKRENAGRKQDRSVPADL